MKGALVMNKFRMVALFLALAVVSYGAIQVARGGPQKKEDDLDNRSRWIHSEDGHKRMVESRGKAEFNDDYTDIKDVTPGGYVRVEESRNGQSQRYEVRRDTGGQLSRSYFRNGKEQPLDDAARAWIAKTILHAVRQGGMDAEKRAQSILRQKGVAGVLAEIDLITSDYGKRLYFQALLKHGNLSGAALTDMLGQAARQVSSDYEQAELLIGVASVMVGKADATRAFFDAVDTIGSDYEHSRVLTTVLRKNPASRELLTLVAASTRRISSDYEKAGVLKKVAAMYLDDEGLRNVFFKIVSSIDSDYEHRGVLSALVKKGDLNQEVLNELLDSAVSISSDYEKATFLVEVSNAYTNDSRLRNQFMRVVETIKSDYERGRVLSVLLKNKQIG
jgi:hypothetical protein